MSFVGIYFCLMNNIYALVIVVLAVLPSCKKNDVTTSQPKDDSIYRQLRDCTIDAHYDSVRLATAILGTWQEVWLEAGGARHASDSNLRYTLRADNRYTSMINGRSWGAGHWRIIPADGEYFQLVMADTVHTWRSNPNRVLSCGNGLFLEDAERNGSNQYFVRVP